MTCPVCGGTLDPDVAHVQHDWDCDFGGGLYDGCDCPEFCASCCQLSGCALRPDQEPIRSMREFHERYLPSKLKDDSLEAVVAEIAREALDTLRDALRPDQETPMTDPTPVAWTSVDALHNMQTRREDGTSYYSPQVRLDRRDDCAPILRAANLLDQHTGPRSR